MNRTKIEWTENGFTWNPVTGCFHTEQGVCSVGDKCYARKIVKRFPHRYPQGFEPTWHESRILDPYHTKKPSKIFVCSMGDLFGKWVPQEWIVRIITVAKENPHHTFLFLTKNPMRYVEFRFPQNCWLGTTINSQRDINRVHKLMRENESNIHFISFEPLYNPIQLPWEYIVQPQHRIDWIIIGAQTGPYLPPRRDWVLSLIEQGRRIGSSIFLKDNLHWPETIQEFPDGGSR